MNNINLPTDGRELRGALKEAYGILAGDDALQLQGSAEQIIGETLAVPVTSPALNAAQCPGPPTALAA